MSPSSPSISHFVLNLQILLKNKPKKRTFFSSISIMSVKNSEKKMYVHIEYFDSRTFAWILWPFFFSLFSIHSTVNFICFIYARQMSPHEIKSKKWFNFCRNWTIQCAFLQTSCFLFVIKWNRVYNTKKKLIMS